MKEPGPEVPQCSTAAHSCGARARSPHAVADLRRRLPGSRLGHGAMHPPARPRAGDGNVVQLSEVCPTGVLAPLLAGAASSSSADDFAPSGSTTVVAFTGPSPLVAPHR